VPEAPVALRVFVEGALFNTLSRQLGISNALDVSEQIRGALVLALRDDLHEEASGIRLRSRSSGPLPAVLVVSRASLVVFLLRDLLSDGAPVTQLQSLEALENHLRERRPQRALIIVDRRHPCVGVEACATLLEHATKHSTVVWWGAQEAERGEVAARLTDGPALLAADLEMDLADLGVLCRRAMELM